MIDSRLVLQDLLEIMQLFFPILKIMTGLFIILSISSLLKRAVFGQHQVAKKTTQEQNSPEDPEIIRAREFRQLEFRNRFNAHKHWIETHRKFHCTNTNTNDDN